MVGLPADRARVAVRPLREDGVADGHREHDVPTRLRRLPRALARPEGDRPPQRRHRPDARRASEDSRALPQSRDEQAPGARAPSLDYLKQFYADTANFGNPIALRAALEFFGVEHVLFGTDFGFSQDFARETIEDVETVVRDDAERRAVYEHNATRVLRIHDAVTA